MQNRNRMLTHKCRSAFSEASLHNLRNGTIVRDILIHFHYSKNIYFIKLFASPKMWNCTREGLVFHPSGVTLENDDLLNKKDGGIHP